MGHQLFGWFAAQRSGLGLFLLFLGLPGGLCAPRRSGQGDGETRRAEAPSEAGALEGNEGL